MNCPNKVTVTYHFDRCDKGCYGDYCNVDLKFDNKIILNLDDDYHDGSSRQIEGFLKACRMFWGGNFPEVEEININDIKKYGK